MIKLNASVFVVNNLIYNAKRCNPTYELVRKSLSVPEKNIAKWLENLSRQLIR